MKTNILAAIFTLLTFTLTASAQVTPLNPTALILSASSVSGSTTATITSQAFGINPRSGFAVLLNFVLASSGTANITFNFQVSSDGVIWSTTTPLSCSIAATGATTVAAFYNFPASAANNVAFVRLASVQNANTAALTINSVTISIDNAR